MGDVYMDLPVDRHRLQERKMAKLQQEIAAMEEKLQENVALRRQLENISDLEQERTQRVIVSWFLFVLNFCVKATF